MRAIAAVFGVARNGFPDFEFETASLTSCTLPQKGESNRRFQQDGMDT